jgi:uncharacterized protein (DUF1778 family)
MAITTPSAKKERLEARITADQKALFQRAADLSGKSLTVFVVESVQAAAEATVQERDVVRLSARDYELFVEALMNPRGPNDNLREAARRYRDFFGE